MNMLAVSDQEAADLRFGRRIAHDIRTTRRRTLRKPTIWSPSSNVRNAVRLNRSRYSTEPSNQTHRYEFQHKKDMMKTITLTPDASGMVDWPTLSNDKKSVVTIGSFDGMHQAIRR